jgi:hypothetical protein
MSITVTQKPDGSLFLNGATSVTVQQVQGGLVVTASEAIPTIDKSTALQAKIDAAKAALV